MSTKIGKSAKTTEIKDHKLNLWTNLSRKSDLGNLQLINMW